MGQRGVGALPGLEPRGAVARRLARLNRRPSSRCVWEVRGAGRQATHFPRGAQGAGPGAATPRAAPELWRHGDDAGSGAGARRCRATGRSYAKRLQAVSAGGGGTRPRWVPAGARRRAPSAPEPAPREPQAGPPRGPQRLTPTVGCRSALPARGLTGVDFPGCRDSPPLWPEWASLTSAYLVQAGPRSSSTSQAGPSHSL